MVNNCANPKCSKPLLYLREGRIFVFDMRDTPAPDTALGRGAHRLEHFWFCGDCSATLQLQQAADKGIHLIPRRAGSQPRRPGRATPAEIARTA